MEFSVFHSLNMSTEFLVKQFHSFITPWVPEVSERFLVGSVLHVYRKRTKHCFVSGSLLRAALLRNWQIFSSPQKQTRAKTSIIKVAAINLCGEQQLLIPPIYFRNHVADVFSLYIFLNSIQVPTIIYVSEHFKCVLSPFSDNHVYFVILILLT